LPARMVVTNALTNIFEGPFCLGIDAANADIERRLDRFESHLR